jgi:flagellar export protein FliJ
MKPRECWPVLAKKADEGVDAAQELLVLARKKLEQLMVSRDKIIEMMHEYKLKSFEIQSRLHCMTETTNYRHFINQLQVLLQQANFQVGHAQAEVNNAKNDLIQAQLKKMKMQALVEQDLKAVQNFTRRLEQKQMDALGVTLYNLKAQ